MDQVDSIFMRNFAIVLAVLTGMTIIFIILARVISSQVRYEDNVAQAAAIADRIAPVGKVSIGEGGDAAGTGTPEPQQSVFAMMQPQNTNQDSGGGQGAGLGGEQVYQQACFACHSTGAGGAPMLEPAAWQDRLDQGTEALVSHAIDGYQGEAGIMPPKGGRMDLSDDAIRGAVEYMVSQVQ